MTPGSESSDNLISVFGWIYRESAVLSQVCSKTQSAEFPKDTASIYIPFQPLCWITIEWQATYSILMVAVI